jgi:FSR family fosmidomycin resistance protein-like MFS transporter
MEQAIEQRAVSPPIDEAERFHTGRVLTVSSSHAVHDTYSAFLVPLLPKFIETLALTKTEAGSLTLFLQIPSLFQPVIGHLSDRHNLRLLVIIAPAIAGTMMSLMGLAPTYLVLAMLLLLAGVGSAGLHAIGPVVVGQQAGVRLGRGMSFWMVGGEMGRTLGPLVIVSAVGVLGLRHTGWLMIFGWLTSVIVYIRLKDIPRPVSSLAETSDSVWTVVRRMGPFLLPLSGIIATRAFLNAALTTYLPIFLSEEGASLWLAGVSLTVLEGAGVVGALAGGMVSDRLGRKPVLAASLMVSPLLMFVFMATGEAARFPLLILMGLFTLSTTPVIMAVVQENYPENRALANGAYMALAFVIRSGAVVMLGLMADNLGNHQAFIISGILALAGLPFLAILPVRNRKRKAA